MILSFAAVIFAFGAGLVMFFMTYLSAAAEAGYGVLQAFAGPLLPFLERMLLFLFGKQFQQDALYPMPDKDQPVYIPAGEISAWSENIAWGAVGLLLLIGLILCALGVWYLLRWLFSRTAQEQRRHMHWSRVIRWAQKLWAVLDRGIKWAVQYVKGYRDAVRLYFAFRRWGRRSGLPQLLSETPGEYGSRFQNQFPSLAADIGRIVEAYNLRVYAELALDDAHLAGVDRSWKRLRSTRYWPARLKSWFFHEKG